MINLGTYSIAWSVSDLHLGGAPGFQMFHPSQEERLAACIDGFRADGSTTLLLLNGDIIDFLAEDPYTPFNLDGALLQVERVMKRLPRLFDALAEFAKHGTLVIAIGNHDLELAHAPVQAAIRARVGGSLRFEVGGEPLVATVAGHKVEFVHGNAVDRWNRVDYAELRAWIREHAGGASMPKRPLDVCQGTLVVQHALNPLKRDHWWLDQVQVDTPHLLALAAKLDPAGTAGATTRMAAAQLLGEDRAGAGEPFAVMTDPRSSAEILAAAEIGSFEALDLDGELGFLDWTNPKKWAEWLTQSWKQLLSGGLIPQHHTAIQRSEEELARRAVGADAVIAGHTHTPRLARIARRGPIYANTGTWASVLVPDAQQVLANWPRLEEGLRCKSEDDARALWGGTPLANVRRRPGTFVRVDADGLTLCEAALAGGNPTVTHQEAWK